MKVLAGRAKRPTASWSSIYEQLKPVFNRSNGAHARDMAPTPEGGRPTEHLGMGDTAVKAESWTGSEERPPRAGDEPSGGSHPLRKGESGGFGGR